MKGNERDVEVEEWRYVVKMRMAVDWMNWLLLLFRSDVSHAPFVSYVVART